MNNEFLLLIGTSIIIIKMCIKQGHTEHSKKTETRNK